MYPKRRRTSCVTGSSFQTNVPCVRLDEAEDTPHGGGLTGAIRAQKTHDATRRHQKACPIECNHIAISLGKRLYFEHQRPSP